LKFSLGGKQSIEFKTDVVGLESISPVQKSNHFVPQWFKNMDDYIVRQPNPEGRVPNAFGKKKKTAKKFSGGTVKRCPAIIDLITEGFIIPMWSDFLIQRNDTLLEWDNKNFPYGIEFHSKEQISHWKLKKTDFPEGVKFVNPWRIYTPPGYSVLFVAPFYEFEKRFTVLPGIVETDSYHHVNFPSIIHTNQDLIIERGTPFIQVIPFKRENWDFDVSRMTEKDIDDDTTHKNHLNTKFKNAYRSITSSFNNS